MNVASLTDTGVVSSEMNEADALGKGHGANIETVDYLAAKLTLELELLRKVIYKSNNQHRSGGYMRLLRKIHSSLKRFQSSPVLRILSLEFAERWISLQRLICSAMLLQQVIVETQKAAKLLTGLLAQTFFVPFALTMLACLSRVHFLLSEFLIQVVTSYNKCASSIPSELSCHDPVEASSTSHAECLPEAAQLNWRGKLPHLCLKGKIRRPSPTQPVPVTENSAVVNSGQHEPLEGLPSNAEDAAVAGGAEKPSAERGGLRQDRSAGKGKGARKRKKPVDEQDFFSLLTGLDT